MAPYVVAASLAAVLVVLGVVWYLTTRQPGREDPAPSFATGTEWSAAVQRIAAQFNCPCGKCGVTRLDVCTCDIARGAVETKGFIATLLNQGLKQDEVIKQVEERYGNRI